MAALREVDLSTGGCSFLELTVTKRCQGRRVKTDHIVLRDWLYKHRYNAYPTRAETLVLANKTQLTKKQVSIWFINARRRILPEIIRREGRDPQKFVRGRSCSSLFSSTSVSGHISSTSSSSSFSSPSYSTSFFFSSPSPHYPPPSASTPPPLLFA